jgi:hypothetical protein
MPPFASRLLPTHRPHTRAGQAKAGVLVFNGVVSTADSASGGWQGATMNALQTQMQAVQEDVYMQRLKGSAPDMYEGACPWYAQPVASVLFGGSWVHLPSTGKLIGCRRVKVACLVH